MKITTLSLGNSHKGSVRSINEDAFIERPELGLWAVADGMGGHDAGDIASSLAVDSLNNISPQASFQALTEKVAENISITNQKLRQMAAGISVGEKRKIIGTTIVVLLIDKEYSRYRILWAGDSRAYRMQNDVFEQLNWDHSEANEMAAKGILTPEEAEVHPLSNVITRAVGADQSIEIDIIEGHIETGDVFLLCSDGLNKDLTNAEIAQLMQDGNLIDINKALIHSCLLRQASDNITVITVKIEENLESETLEENVDETTIQFY